MSDTDTNPAVVSNYARYGPVELARTYYGWQGRRLRDDLTTRYFGNKRSLHGALKGQRDTELRWRP
jgi:hypothetical protein